MTELEPLVDEEIGVIPSLDEMEGMEVEIPSTPKSLPEKMFPGISGTDLAKVIWLSVILFFLVGTYWLLSSLKDPIMSSISGVSLSN